MDVLCSIAHLANDDLLLIIVEPADITALAFWAFPWEELDKVGVQRRLMACAVIGLPATTALHTLLCRVKCQRLLALMARPGKLRLK